MARAIMVQGTTSNAGKSLIAAALCRIFRQDGYKTAPFKSQNMSLNSYITLDGLEMGRAQVMQAQAAGIPPDVRMNPILLKPTGEKGSQVIVMGKVLGDMPAKDYFAYKQKLVPAIMEAYCSIAEEYDIIVLEGAGSPAEINLKQDDIVNMGMAKRANAPVLLVADIDRGGVFASIAGTLLLLEEDERARVKGTIINKFRGDLDILQSGITMIEEIAHTKVLGVVPYTLLDIDDEDSLSTRLDAVMQENLLTIAVIKLPRISNFTDFNVFGMVDGVNVVYATSSLQLERADMIILPGTKNTMEDLRWLRQSGMETAILRQAGLGKPIMGICGGYQMLGLSICDPHKVEGGGELRGMGLLPVETVFAAEKTTTRVCGSFGKIQGCFARLSGLAFEGYEIHMGATAAPHSLSTLCTIGEETMRQDGCCLRNVAGSYVHGIFDSSEVVNALVAMLMERKGLKPEALRSFSIQEHREKQYDKLAEVVRRSLDMEQIYAILQAGEETM